MQAGAAAILTHDEAGGDSEAGSSVWHQETRQQSCKHVRSAATGVLATIVLTVAATLWVLPSKEQRLDFKTGGIISASGSLYFGLDGGNCQDDSVIMDAAECKKAAEYLGIWNKWRGGSSSKSKIRAGHVPTGCWTRKDDNRCWNTKRCELSVNAKGRNNGAYKAICKNQDVVEKPPEAWEEFSEDSVNKIFQIQSLQEQDYLYADEEVTAGSSGIGNDFKVHMYKSKGQIRLQGFRGKYVYWEHTNGVWSLSLKTLGDGNSNGFIFYRTSGSPTFALMMGSSAVKVCRKEKGNGLVVSTPAKPCWSPAAEKWTFRDVTSYYDTDGVNNFGNGKNERMQPWEDFSEDSVNKIFQIQSVSHEDYLYAAGDKLVAGNSGIGEDFKVQIWNSKGQIMLQDFQGKYVFWEHKNGVWSVSLKTRPEGSVTGFIFYLKAGGPTFELLMGSSVVKLCRKEIGNGLEVGTPANPCVNQGAGKWTFKDVTSLYEKQGVAAFGNGKDNRIL